MASLKVGVLGASFNPLHKAHLKLLEEAKSHFHLDRIVVVPACHNPLEVKAPEVPPPLRQALVREVLQSYPFVEVDDQEIKRGGLSYAVSTLKNLHRRFKNLFFIMGMDQLMMLDQWRDFEEILKISHLIVAPRTGFEWKKQTWPVALQEGIKSFQKNQAVLKTGKKIFRMPLCLPDISSSLIRKRVRQGLEIKNMVPGPVARWIRKEKLYLPEVSPPGPEDLLQFCYSFLEKKKAERPLAFDMRGFSGFPFPFTLIVSGLNTRHTKTLAQTLYQEVKKQKPLRLPLQTEGFHKGRWIVLDFGHLAVHILYHYAREHYSLEELWKKAGAKVLPPRPL